jgi:hypothetical protein
MVNNHFADDSLLSISADQGLLMGLFLDLDTFCELLQGSMVNAHKTDYWLIGLDFPLE